jgi:hypothetical protein
MCGQPKQPFTQLGLKAVHNGEHQNQGSHAQGDAEYRCKRNERYETATLAGTQIAQTNKQSDWLSHNQKGFGDSESANKVNITAWSDTSFAITSNAHQQGCCRKTAPATVICRISGTAIDCYIYLIVRTGGYQYHAPSIYFCLANFRRCCIDQCLG